MDRSATWGQLPDHIVIEILLYLTLPDRFQASLTCKSWNNCFNLHYIWKDFTFLFYNASHKRFLELFKRYGRHLQNVTIYVDQSVPDYRQNACEVLKGISGLAESRLRSLRIKFTGENPIFYAGKEFIDALIPIFSTPAKKEMLQHVDLSGLNVTFEEKLLDLLAENHKMIKSLKIINNVYVCKISPACILNFVNKCRRLERLSLYHCSLDDSVLTAFTEENRKPLDVLAIKCRREEKYGKDFENDTWAKVSKMLPNLKVTLIFDYTCPLHKVAEIMKPAIPVVTLRLETFTYIYDEVRMAYGNYSKTLKKLVLNTPLSRNAPELNNALVELATECPNLISMHVFCVLEENTVNKILELHPPMKERGSYTLRYTNDEAPWKPGKDCGEDE